MQYFSLRTTANRWSAHWLINPSPPLITSLYRGSNWWCLPRCARLGSVTPPPSLFMLAAGLLDYWPNPTGSTVAIVSQLEILNAAAGEDLKLSANIYNPCTFCFIVFFCCVDRTCFLGTLLRLHQSPNWHYLFYRIATSRLPLLVGCQWVFHQLGPPSWN